MKPTAVACQVLDMIPRKTSPTPSPASATLANNQTSPIDLPCIPTEVPHPPLTPLSSTPPQSTSAQPNPSSSRRPSPVASETDFPDVPFPGAFPQDLPTEFAVPNFQEVQSTITKAVQSTLDAL